MQRHRPRPEVGERAVLHEAQDVLVRDDHALRLAGRAGGEVELRRVARPCAVEVARIGRGRAGRDVLADHRARAGRREDLAPPRLRVVEVEGHHHRARARDREVGDDRLASRSAAGRGRRGRRAPRRRAQRAGQPARALPQLAVGRPRQRRVLARDARDHPRQRRRRVVARRGRRARGIAERERERRRVGVRDERLEQPRVVGGDPRRGGGAERVDVLPHEAHRPVGERRGDDVEVGVRRPVGQRVHHARLDARPLQRAARRVVEREQGLHQRRARRVARRRQPVDDAVEGDVGVRETVDHRVAHAPDRLARARLPGEVDAQRDRVDEHPERAGHAGVAAVGHAGADLHVVAAVVARELDRERRQAGLEERRTLLLGQGGDGARGRRAEAVPHQAAVERLARRARTVERQPQQVGVRVEHLGPVHELGVERLGVGGLPDRDVADLQRGRRRCRAAVERAELAREHVEGPAVVGEVVLEAQQRPALVGEPHQRPAHPRRLGEVDAHPRA